MNEWICAHSACGRPSGAAHTVECPQVGTVPYVASADDCDPSEFDSLMPITRSGGLINAALLSESGANVVLTPALGTMMLPEGAVPPGGKWHSNPPTLGAT